MRALYVEDNRLDAEFVRRVLARQSPPWPLEIAPTLAQARALLKLPPPGPPAAHGAGVFATAARHAGGTAPPAAGTALDGLRVAGEPGAALAFDLVLIDLGLPDGHGLDLVREIRAHALPLAIVVLTSQGDEQMVLTVLKAGADDYLAKGHEFALKLPATLRAARQRFTQAQARHARTLQVLYADPYMLDIDLTRRHLAAQAPNIRLDTVLDGRAALLRLPANAEAPCPYDVVMLDYRLPGHSGLDVLKVLREERGLDLPVVMVTGQGSEEVAAMAMRLGATDYVVKSRHYLHALPSVLESAVFRVQTQREQAALKRSEERLALVLRGSNDAPIDLDLLHGHSHIAPRLWQLLGWDEAAPAADAAGAIAGQLPALDPAQALPRWDTLLATCGTGFEAEFDLRHRAGHGVPFLLRCVVVRDADGRALRVAGTCTDLTERRRSEGDIRRANAALERRVADRTEELEQTLHELEAFSYSVSHDLRAPLRAIDGLSALLQLEHGEALGAAGRDKLRLLREGAARMDRLIHDLLDFARTARQPLTRVPLSPALLGQLVDHCLAEYAQTIAQRGIVVEVGALPACSADPTLLRQALLNLIDNAVKYSRGSAAPRISIGSQQIDGQTAYVVRDNGAGFDMRHAGKLFAVFQRLHRDSEFEGTGIGLAIVERIVKRHGGRIWADSRPGEGASFFFTLEAAAANELPNPSAHGSPASGTG